MMKRHGWTRRVLVLALVVAMAWILLPDLATAQQKAQLKNMVSQFDVRLSGFVQVQGDWTDDQPATTGTSHSRRSGTAPGQAGLGEESFRAGAGASRMTFIVTGPQVFSAASLAVLEWEFNGVPWSSVASNATLTPTAAGNADRTDQALIMRLAYMRFVWPQVYALIGQDAFLFHLPFGPFGMGNGSEIAGSLARSGQIFASQNLRVPQIQVGTNPIPIGMGATFRVSTGIGRNVTGIQTTNNYVDSASRTALPAWFSAANLTVPIMPFKRNAVLNVSHYLGQERLIGAAAATTPAEDKATQTVDNRGLAVSALLPLGPALPFIGAWDVRGAWFTAQNMGGAHQLGFNTINGYGSSTGIAGTACGTGTFVASHCSQIHETQADGWWIGTFGQITRNLHVGGGYGETADDRDDLRKIPTFINPLSTTPAPNLTEGQQVWYVFTGWDEGPFRVQLNYHSIMTDFVRGNTTGCVAAFPSNCPALEQRTETGQAHLVFKYSF